MSEVKNYLARATIVADERPYTFVRLHPRAITTAASIIAETGDPFCALIVDQHEVSLVIPSEAYEDFIPRLRDHTANPERYRVITIDVELPPDLVGFMAAVSAALAQAGIPIMPYAAYSRDHLMVPERFLPEALRVLEALKT